MTRLLYVGLSAVLACSMVSSHCAAQQNSIPDKRENFHLFLLVGQSNMAGRGTVSEADRLPHPRVLMLNQQNEWVPAVDPLHFDKPKVAGTGLGKTFAQEVVKTCPEITVGLIPCAVGGSPISAWEPGAYYKPTDSHPWDDAIERAHIAMKEGVLKGVLWHQGESDSSAALAPLYEQKLHDLIARFRKELNAPDVPFVVGQLGKFPERPWSEFKQQVDAAHRTLPEKVDNTAFVSAEGLTHKGDNVHFDSASYRELGRRYAEAYLKMTEKPAP